MDFRSGEQNSCVTLDTIIVIKEGVYENRKNQTDLSGECSIYHRTTGGLLSSVYFTETESLLALKTYFWIYQSLGKKISPPSYKMMLDSVSHSTFLPNTTICESLMSWSELFGTTEENDLPFEHQTGCDSSWTSIHPEYWTRHNVCEWLQFCCDQYKLDANCISFSHFNINGQQLCCMTQEDFLNAAGICGEYLYFILQNIKTHGVSFFQDNEDTKSSEKDYNDKACLRTGSIKSQDFQSHSRTSLQSSHLWEFVRDLLLSPEENCGVLEWEDRNQGIFRVIKSDGLAKMWGQRKKNDRMTYEKLSRALRYYYKTGILERVDRRLVYKFGKNAHGWQDSKL